MVRPSRSLWSRFVALAGIGAIALLAAGCLPPEPEPEPTSPPPPPPPATVYDAACKGTLNGSTAGIVASPAITELSGLSASRRTVGVWWAHNDSGDSARVFAVGDNGRDLGQFTLTGAAALDWEDIAVGPGPTSGVQYLYVGDIGDNNKNRASVKVYRVPEPAIDTSAVNPPAQALGGVEVLTFTYPDSAHDAEALLVDPVSGELFIITKELLGGTGQVFRAPANLAGGTAPTVLTQVGTVSLGSGPFAAITAADVTAAGDFVALRTYGAVVLFPRPAGTPLASAFAQSPCNGAVGDETQGEAIGFTPDGRGYVTASEGATPALHRFVAPAP